MDELGLTLFCVATPGTHLGPILRSELLRFAPNCTVFCTSCCARKLLNAKVIISYTSAYWMESRVGIEPTNKGVADLY